MKNKIVHIISDSFSLKINKEIANFNIINILLNENKSLSDVIIEASKNTDLIVLVNLYNISDPEIIKNIKNIDCNFIYCSEENFEKINKVNEIFFNLKSHFPKMLHSKSRFFRGFRGRLGKKVKKVNPNHFSKQGL